MKHLEVISSISSVNVSGITSRTPKKCKFLANKFKIKNYYKDFKSMIKNNNLDGIMILVSAEQTYNVVKKLLPYKIPLFIEKPAGLNYRECKKLSLISQKYSTPNMVGYNRRFYSIFHKGIKKISEYGNLVGISIEGHERFWKVKNNKRSNKVLNSWLYINSTHTIDLLNFFGGRYSKIKSFNSSKYNNNPDQFNLIIKFKNGCLGTYISNWYSPGGWSVKLFGEGVTVEFNPLEKGYWYNTNFKKRKILPSKYDLKFKYGFYEQLNSFIHLMKYRKNIWPSIDLNKACITMKMAEKLIKKQN